MKKILYSLLLTILCLFPVGVFAAGNIIASPSSLSIEVGSSKTFTITATNTIGDVSISSSNSNVASVSTGEWGTGMVDEQQTKTGTITVTGKSVGMATITLTLDAATFDGEDLAGQKRTITVNVVPKPQNNNNNTNNNNNNNNSNGNTNNSHVTDNRSKNNNIKELSVEGFDIVKVDNNNYTLSVSMDISSINIKAVAEDAKSKITGVGQRELNIGENNIEVVVTSESGSQNKIIIKVIRKDGYYLEDLDNVLKNDKIDDINIIINSDSKISSQDIAKIKNSGKVINFNYLDDNRKIIYSWIIDGSKLKAFDEINTKINFESDKKKEISKISNYAEGLNISLSHKGILPSGAKIKIYVGDKYSDDDTVNIYYFNEEIKTLELVEGKNSIENGYVIFEVNKGTDYFVTMSTILDSNEKVVTKSKFSSTIISIILIIFVLLGILFIILKKKKNKAENKNSNIKTLEMNEKK